MFHVERSGNMKINLFKKRKEKLPGKEEYFRCIWENLITICDRPDLYVALVNAGFFNYEGVSNKGMSREAYRDYLKGLHPAFFKRKVF